MVSPGMARQGKSDRASLAVSIKFSGALRLRWRTGEPAQRSPDRFYPALPAESVAYPEDVGDVDPAVVQALEDAEILQILANALSAFVDATGRQFHLPVGGFLFEAFGKSFVPPPFCDISKLAGNDHAVKGGEGLVYPRIVFLKFFDAYAGSCLHPLLDAFVMQRVSMVRVLFGGVFGGRAQRFQERARTYPSIGVR